MRVYLEIGSKTGKTKRVALTSDAVIGRGSSSNLRIGSDKVSRKHCLLTITDTGVMLRDLGSMNGTFVNGYRLQPNQDVSIGPNTKLVIGPAQFLIQFGAEYEASVGQTPGTEAAPGNMVPGFSPEVDPEQPTTPHANPIESGQPVPAVPVESPPIINLARPNGNAGTMLDNLIANDSIASDETVDFQTTAQHSDLQTTRGEEFPGNLVPPPPVPTANPPVATPDPAVALPNPPVATPDPAVPMPQTPQPQLDAADDGDDSLNDFLSALE